MPEHALTPSRQMTKAQSGCFEIQVSGWAAFRRFIDGPGSAAKDLVYRGHADSAWSLLPTLHRQFQRGGRDRPSARRVARHLQCFQYAARGRRGASPVRLSDDEWWALGQHYGLATPLLDWTHSPYVAAFFAMQSEIVSSAKTRPADSRAVWVLDIPSIKGKGFDLTNRRTLKGRTEPREEAPPILEVYRPLSDDNQRLVNQAGLFIKVPMGISVEAWIRQHFAGQERPVLGKIVVPNTEECRSDFLRGLMKMNINHATLFPDLIGASQYANRVLDEECAVKVAELRKLDGIPVE